VENERLDTLALELSCTVSLAEVPTAKLSQHFSTSAVMSRVRSVLGWKCP